MKQMLPRQYFTHIMEYHQNFDNQTYSILVNINPLMNLNLDCWKLFCFDLIQSYCYHQSLGSEIIQYLFSKLIVLFSDIFSHNELFVANLLIMSYFQLTVILFIIIYQKLSIKSHLFLCFILFFIHITNLF